ncbi:WGR domain-containing protein [Labrenzia sp. 011]|nr:WGR domain-containing protein [Labrenzia sp. 011]
MDSTRNMERFYGLLIEPTLFGGFAVLRTWERIGTWGRTRLD